MQVDVIINLLYRANFPTMEGSGPFADQRPVETHQAKELEPEYAGFT